MGREGGPFRGLKNIFFCSLLPSASFGGTVEHRPALALIQGYCSILTENSKDSKGHSSAGNFCLFLFSFPLFHSFPGPHALLSTPGYHWDDS